MTMNVPKRNPRNPPLRLSPYAWAKLLFLRDYGPTEVGGFGISAPQDFLRIEDICLVAQRCTAVSVKFDDTSVADYFSDQVEKQLPPERFARIWIHTHPGNSAAPSSTDEQTFVRCFGRADWAVMFIVAQGGQTYARMQFRAGPGGQLELPVEVDFEGPFPSSQQSVWEQEYLDHVRIEEPFRSLAADDLGTLEPELRPDPWADFHPMFLEGAYECARSVSAAERIGAAICA
jgi:proteasome lid subunit RPN8/RPN11